jgi:hypothetical protein
VAAFIVPTAREAKRAALRPGCAPPEVTRVGSRATRSYLLLTLISSKWTNVCGSIRKLSRIRLSTSETFVLWGA